MGDAGENDPAAGGAPDVSAGRWGGPQGTNGRRLPADGLPWEAAFPPPAWGPPPQGWGPPTSGGPGGPWAPAPPPEPSSPHDRPFLEVPGAPPASRQDAAAWIAFALVGFLGGELVALVLTAVAASLAGEGNQLSRIASMAAPPEWYIGVSLVGLWVGFFGGPWIASKARGTGRLLVDLGVRFRWTDLWGLLIGVGGQILVSVLYAPFIKHLKNFNAPTEKLTGGAHGAGFAVIAILTVLGAPFFEELFFRGLLFRALARLFAPARFGPTATRTVGVVAAVVLDGLLFGLAHAELEQLAGLAIFGMILAAVSYRTGRLGMNMVSHASFNLVAVLAILGSRGGVIH
jgi:membrane protease YdiL (CAAX protease family)